MQKPNQAGTAPESVGPSHANGNGAGQGAEILSGVTFPETYERIDDLQWSEDAEARGQLAPYAGRKVAILNKTVVGVGDNGLELRDAVCVEYGVPPSRPVIAYVEGDAD
jgi:hypothetical protein